MMGNKSFVFRFDDVEVREREFSLIKAGKVLAVEPKAFRTLIFLLRNPERLIPKEELLNSIWGDAAVTDGSLTRCIWLLRRALGDDISEHRYIETVATVGYRFVCKVEVFEDASAPQKPPDQPPPNAAAEKTAMNPPPQSAKTLRRRSRFLFGALFLFIVAAVASVTYWARSRRAWAPFQNYNMLQVSFGRKAMVADISPDGRFVAIVKKNSQGYNRLWLHNIATNTDVQISAAPIGFGSLDFSPDGNYIYICGGKANARDLYRASVLGGTLQKIGENLDSAVAVSPDARHIAYMMSSKCPQPGQWCVVETDPDGARKTVLFAKSGTNRPDDFAWPLPGVLAWSPDGRQLAVAVYEAGQGFSNIEAIEVETRSSRELFKVEGKLIRTLDWLPDGHGFLVNFAAKANPRRWQIGTLSYPEGNFRELTNDTNSYYFDRTSSDGRRVAAVLGNGDVRSLYLLPGTGSDDSSPKPAVLPIQDLRTFGWDADGSLLLSGDGKLARTRVDGSHETDLLEAPGMLTALAPVPCDDGRYLVFEWDHKDVVGTENLWRMNSDGSNLVQLTRGVDAENPVCDQQGKWVYFVDYTKPQPMRIPIEGGSAEPVPGSKIPNGFYAQGSPALSPEGDRLVYLAKVQQPGETSSELKAVIVNLKADGAESPRLVDVDQQLAYAPQFTPDGKGLAYISWGREGFNSIWVQPLDNQPRRQITSLFYPRIFQFGWSPDGKTLGILQARVGSDVVVLTDSDSSH